MIYADNTKKCSKCGEKRDITIYFRKNKQIKDGYDSQCKLCKGVKLIRDADYKPKTKTDNSKQQWKTKQYTSNYKEDKKRCYHCKEYKDTTEYTYNNITYDNLNKICTSCIDNIHKERKASDNQYHKRKQLTLSEKKYNNLRGSSTRRDIPLTISKRDFIDWYKETKDICIYCGIDKDTYNTLMTSISKDKTNPYYKVSNQINHSPYLTIDRKDNTKGYTLNNICKCCWFCNVTKGSILSIEEISLIGKSMINRIIKNI